MTTRHADKKKNFDDLLSIADDKRAELIDGEIVMMAPASVLHSSVQTNLVTEINRSISSSHNPKIPSDFLLLCEAWTYYDQHNSFVHDLLAWPKVVLSDSLC